MTRRGFGLGLVAVLAAIAIVVVTRPRAPARPTPPVADAPPTTSSAPTAWRPTPPDADADAEPATVVGEDLSGVPVPDDERVETGTAEGYAGALADQLCACVDRACVELVNQRFGAALGQVVPSADHAAVAAAFARGRACVDSLPPSPR